ncbi:MAG: Inositol-monophosphatase [Labilithrix sp.]|nr:Inositol-monophosphatase [Labilithrix sp.]
MTRYDRESEDLIREELAKSLPFAIVGEEHGGSPDGIAFYVDPLDGTTNFVHGHPFWCVSIGLVSAGKPVLGVVLAPQLGLEWFGWVAASGERRATRRSASNAITLAPGSEATSVVVEGPFAVSEVASFGDALIATGFPYDRTGPDNNFDAFVAIKQRCQAVRRCGSAALDLCLVADGTYEGYWERKLRPWDIAAGLALVRAAGGRVTDFDSVGLETGLVIATNGRIHDALMRELARVATASGDG